MTSKNSPHMGFLSHSYGVQLTLIPPRGYVVSRRRHRQPCMWHYRIDLASFHLGICSSNCCWCFCHIWVQNKSMRIAKRFGYERMIKSFYEAIQVSNLLPQCNQKVGFGHSYYAMKQEYRLMIYITSKPLVIPRLQSVTHLLPSRWRKSLIFFTTWGQVS